MAASGSTSGSSTRKTTAAGRSSSFVHPDARGSGLAEALIQECRRRCGRRAGLIGFQTARDNLRAQRVYERIGATRKEWLEFSLPTRLD
jgi:GNAT superfamily N-acetyltransferase